MDHTMPEGAVWRGVTGGLRTIYIQVKNHAPETGVLGGESQGSVVPALRNVMNRMCHLAFRKEDLPRSE